MEKQEHLREEVKSQERIFIQKLEDLINNRYRPLLFDKYVFSLSKIQACYAAPNLTLKQSDSCAQEHTANYMEIDENYTRILRKYEDGITHCVAQCSKDLQPILECYNECFSTFQMILDKRQSSHPSPLKNQYK